MTFKPITAIKQMARDKTGPTLAEDVLALQTSDKFRLAAELLDLGDHDMAAAVGTRACQEIFLATLFGGRFT